MMFLPTIGSRFPSVLLQDLVRETQAQHALIERPIVKTTSTEPETNKTDEEVDSLTKKAAESLTLNPPENIDDTVSSFPSVAVTLLGQPSEALVKLPGTPQLLHTTTHLQQQNSMAAIKAIVFRRDDGTGSIPVFSWGNGEGGIRTNDDLSGGGYSIGHGGGMMSRGGGRGGSFAGDAGSTMWRQSAVMDGYRGGGGGGGFRGSGRNLNPHHTFSSDSHGGYRGRGGYRGDSGGYSRGGGGGHGWGSSHRDDSKFGGSHRGGLQYQPNGGRSDGAGPNLNSDDGWDQQEGGSSNLHLSQHTSSSGRGGGGGSAAGFDPYSQQGGFSDQSISYAQGYSPQAQAMYMMQQENFRAMMQQSFPQQQPQHPVGGGTLVQNDGHQQQHPGAHQQQQMYSPQYMHPQMHPQAVYEMMQQQQQQHFQQQYQNYQQQHATETQNSSAQQQQQEQPSRTDERGQAP